MTQFTKKAIMETFMELLSRLPLNQITVQMISDECGISRNTFYYHFGDIYALLESTFQVEFEKWQETTKKFPSRKEEVKVALSFLLEERQAVYNIYDSLNHQLLEQFIYRVTEDIITERVRTVMGENSYATEEDIQLITFSYQALFLGLILEWMRRGMKDDISERIVRAEWLFLEGSRLALSQPRPETSEIEYF